MNKQTEKQQLRKTMHTLEARLPERYLAQADRKIAAQLLAMPEYQAADTVFCFVSTGREIDTHPILEAALEAGKTLCVPRCLGGGIMELRSIQSLDVLTPGAYGIPEPPEDAPLVSTDAVDFAVLPCLTCNHLGQRLGRGGGYYDRLLPQLHCPTVLICREQLMSPEVPVEEHDMRCTMLVTEKGILTPEA